MSFLCNSTVSQNAYWTKTQVTAIAGRPVGKSPAGEEYVSAAGQRRPGRDEELKLQDITSSGKCCFI